MKTLRTSSVMICNWRSAKLCLGTFLVRPMGFISGAAPQRLLWLCQSAKIIKCAQIPYHLYVIISSQLKLYWTFFTLIVRKLFNIQKTCKRLICDWYDWSLNIAARCFCYYSVRNWRHLYSFKPLACLVFSRVFL